MASLRDIKKDINFLADQMLAECFSFMEYAPGNNMENVLEIMHDIQQLRVNLLYKLNNIPKDGNVKKHCQDIISEMYEMNMQLLEELNSLSKE